MSSMSALLGALALTQGCSAPPGTNRQIGIPNPGFESGALAPWATFQSVQAAVGTSPTHSGKFSLSEASGKGSVYADVKGLKPGLTYIVSAWVCASEDATATAQIAVFDPSTNIAGYADPVSPGTAWTQVRYAFKIGSGETARIHLFRNEGSGTLFWDDIEVSTSSQ
jgi:hypothetical protein